MEKKFIKYLLFGVFAFVFSVAFVGCGEDYDGDIDDLKKADAATLQAAQSAVATAKSELQSQITGVETSAAAKAVVEAKAAALAEVATQLGNLKVGEYSLNEVAQIVGQVEALGLESLSTTVEELKGLLEDESTIEAIKDAAALKLQVDAIDKYLAGYKDSDKTLKQELEDLKALIGVGGTISDELVDAIVAKLTENGVGELVTLDQVNGLITSITIVGTTNDLIYNVVPAKATYTFPNLSNALGTPINFIKDQVRPEVGKIDVILKVTPANAKLEGKKVYLVNSKGETGISDYIEVSDPVRYDGLLTKADATSTGLYKVSFTIKSFYSPETDAAFKLLTKDSNNNGKIDDGDKPIAFAIAVDGKSSSIGKAERPVLSTFNTGITIEAPKSVYTIASVIDVDDDKLIKFAVTTTVEGEKQKPKDVTLIYNAFAGNTGTEYVWKNTADFAKWDTDIEKAGRNDERYIQPLIVTDLNSNIVVNILNFASNRALAYYVGLDLQNASDKDKKLWQDEIAAGNITGVNQAKLLGASGSDANKDTLLIKGSNLQDQEIGFRVYIINHDGTLVDPDGRAFYVRVGAIPSKVPSVGKLTFIPEILTHVADGEMVGTKKVSTTNWATIIGVTDLSEIKDLKLTFKDTDFNEKYGNVVFYTGTPGNYALVSKAPNNLDAVSAIAIGGRTSTGAVIANTLLLSDMDDTKDYTGTLEVIGLNEKAIAQFEVSLKKELPTGFPTAPAFTVKSDAKKVATIDGARFFVPIAPNSKINVTTTTPTTISNFVSATYSIKDILTSSGTYDHVLFSLTAGGITTNGVATPATLATDVAVTIPNFASVKQNVEYVGNLQYDWGHIKQGGTSHIVSFGGDLSRFTVLFAPNQLYQYDNTSVAVRPPMAGFSALATATAGRPWPVITYNAANEEVTLTFDVEVVRKLNTTIFTDDTFAPFSRNEFEKYYDLKGITGKLTATITAPIYVDDQGTYKDQVSLDSWSTTVKGKVVDLNPTPAGLLFRGESSVGSFKVTMTQNDSNPNYRAIANYIKAANNKAVENQNGAYATWLFFYPTLTIKNVLGEPIVGAQSLFNELTAIIGTDANNESSSTYISGIPLSVRIVKE
ncbi:hypothetical protein EZS27_002845 [termite gut metagenome]|uniref:Uncharacterized protein n=1 Tax=termite gut metagenome TaxID=433724 RepID=A0A5J4SX10_9ZZZZ